MPIGLLQSLDIPGKRWDTVSLDLITQLPVTRNGHDAIIVMVDKASKMVHYAATTTKCTAEQVAHIFHDTVVRLHGIPKYIISDRPRIYVIILATTMEVAWHTVKDEYCVSPANGWTN